MTDENHVRVTHRVPEHLRDEAQQATEHGELSNAVRVLYEAVADGAPPADAAQYAAEQVRIDREVETTREHIEAAEDRLEHLQQRRSELLEIREREAEREADYVEALGQIEADIRDGMSVFPGHGAVQQAASVIGKAPVDVIEDLRERNPDLPDRAFQEQHRSEIEWRGTGGR